MEPKRLQMLMDQLIHEAENSRSFPAAEYRDEVQHLSLEKQQAWAQVLSSAASAEESEEMVIGPLLQAFEFSSNLHRYLSLQAAEESLHHALLKAYVQKTFNHVKKSKSMTDRVIYDGVFQGLQSLTRKRPLPILVATLFYEWFAKDFYSDLALAAERDRLPSLKKMFLQIEKDEHRHRAGLKMILTLWKQQGMNVDKIDLFYSRFLLKIVRMDVNTASWAFYNRKLKRNLSTLGMDTDVIFQRSKDYAEKAYQELQSLTVGH
jgi:rubrerythrin